MIKTENTVDKFKTKIVEHEIFVDTTTDKGGSGNYIRPHELLEAAFASCLNISIQNELNKMSINDASVVTKVNLRRDNMTDAIFEYQVEIKGENISSEIESQIKEIIRTCPVRRTLSKVIKFEEK